MGFDIRKAMARAIEKTENPMAPIILQRAHGAVGGLGKLLAGTSNEEVTHALSTRLLKDFSDEEIDQISKKPEFIMACCCDVGTGPD